MSAVLGLSRTEFENLLAPDPASTAGVRIEVLGPLRVVVDDVVTDLASRSQHALLAILALTPNSLVGPDSLIDGLWGARPPAGVVNCLQSRVSRLRRKLRARSDAAAVVGTATGYRLSVAEHQHDLLMFRHLVARARRSREFGELPEAAELFSEALALWRGDPVADLPSLGSRPDVVELGDEWRAVVTEHAEITNKLGYPEQALPRLRRAAETDGLHERTHAALMVALAGSGHQAAALTLFEQLRHRLADELGADPGPELTAAYQRILHREVRPPEPPPVHARRQPPVETLDLQGRSRELRWLCDRHVGLERTRRRHGR